MTEQWLIPDKLCSFDEKVRIEIGPQVIELDCTDENLCDEVTHRQYQVGRRDALGRLIRPDELIANPDIDTKVLEKAVAKDIRRGKPPVAQGEKMACVDWRAKRVPHVWKIYQLQDTGEVNEKTDEPLMRFIQVDQVAGRDMAISTARTLVGGM
jgi:hypothetical protein